MTLNVSVLLRIGWLIVFASLCAPYSAQGEVKGFGPKNGKKLGGFGPYAEISTTVTDADRRNATSIFTQGDQDRSGALERAELDRMNWNSSTREQHDLNGDGRLTLQEITLRFTMTRRQQEMAKKQQRRRASKKPPPPAVVSPRPEDPLITMRRIKCHALATQIFAKRDVNRNSLLQGAEFRKSGKFGDLHGADFNNDSHVNVAELTRWLMDRLPPIASSRLAKPLRIFDEDGDGQISMREFTVQWTNEKLAEFQSMDQNKDGLISPAESFAAPVSGRARNFSKNDALLVNPYRGVTSTLIVQEDVTIDKIVVRVAMSVRNDAQAQVSLVGPDGQRVMLFKGGWQPWTGSILENTLIHDDAPLIENSLPRPPYPRRLRTDALKEKQPGLQQFAGKSARGPWRLTVKNSTQVVGVLHSWSLLVTPKENAPK